MFQSFHSPQGTKATLVFNGMTYELLLRDWCMDQPRTEITSYLNSKPEYIITGPMRLTLNADIIKSVYSATPPEPEKPKPTRKLHRRHGIS